MAGPHVGFARPLLLATTLLGVSLALGGSAQAEPREGEVASGAGAVEVLTLEEAAQLLRLAPEDLRDFAAQGRIPGRRLGEEWRFSRQALRSWLEGTDPPVVEDEELSSILGRGPEDGAAGEQPIGEAPKVTSAEAIFLRNQRVLLGRGDVLLESRSFFSRSDTPAIELVDLRVDGIIVILPQQTKVEQTTFTESLGLRYGLFDETEIFGGGRFQRRIVKPGSQPKSRANFWGLFLGARRTIFRERRYIPSVVLQADGEIPIENGSYAVAGSLSLVKSFDPIVLFGGLQYRHAFDRDFDFFAPKDVLGATLGYAFAVNDELILGTSVSALFSLSDESFGGVRVEDDEEYTLRLALTRTGGRGPYIEPSVTYGLNGAGNFFTFGLSLPWPINR